MHIDVSRRSSHFTWKRHSTKHSGQHACMYVFRRINGNSEFPQWHATRRKRSPWSQAKFKRYKYLALLQQSRAAVLLYQIEGLNEKTYPGKIQVEETWRSACTRGFTSLQLDVTKHTRELTALQWNMWRSSVLLFFSHLLIATKTMHTVVAGQAPITPPWKNTSHIYLCVDVLRRYIAVRGCRTCSSN